MVDAAPPELAYSSSASDDEMENGAGRDYHRSESVQSGSSDATVPLTENTQLLRLETITDKEARRMIGSMKLTAAIAIILAIATCVVKETRPDLVVLNRTATIMNTCWNGAGLAILMLIYVRWGWRVVASRWANMYWSDRRWKAVVYTNFKLIVAALILGGQMAQNGMLLQSPSDFCRLSGRQAAMAAVVWFGWNTLLLTLVIDAHGTNLKDNTSRSDGTVRDLPITFHWPKLILWLILFGAEMWVTAEQSADSTKIKVKVVNGGECTWGADLQCDLPVRVYIGSIVTVLGMIVYCIMFFVYIARGWRQYEKELYQKYRLGNMLIRMQMRINGMVLGTMILSMVLNWFAGRNACANFALTWFGTPSLAIAVTFVAGGALYLTTPRRHRSASKYEAVPGHVMQQFAWTEPDIPRKLTRRNSQIRKVAPELQNEPMFCVEYAIKFFFWSALAYDYTEAEGATFQRLPEDIRELMGEVEAAMQLFGLSKRHMFYDRERGTKVVVAWSEDVILLSVRGSVERANFIADAKFLQTAHIPKRCFKGRVPRVHQGFQESWSASGIRDRVLEHIAALLDSAEDRASVQVYCTGHSLGGAVASLAAFDIARELNVSTQRIKLYTFGCPRLGNKAFVREFHEVVPDTWHIINDQDLVTRIGKLFGLYKRHGQRVVVNKRGDMIVRPTMFETSMQQAMRGGTVVHHQTVSYQHALVAIVTSQLSISGRHVDGLHGLLGLLKGVPQVRIALEAHARQLGTTLADVMRGVGSQAVQSLESLGGATIGAASQRFTASRRMSLMRAVGVNPHDSTHDDAIASESSPASPTGSQASSAASDVVVPVAILVDCEGQVEGDVADCGNVPTIAPGTFTDAEKEMHEGVDNATETGGSTRTASMSSWRRAAHVLGATQFWHSSASAGGNNAEAPSTATTSAPEMSHRCYKIPEDDTAAGGASIEGSAGQTRKCSWHCPLSAKKCDLPSNAKLENNILGIGAKPDMKGCRFGGAKFNCKGGDGGTTNAATVAHAAHTALPPRQQVPPLKPQTYEGTTPQISGLAAGGIAGAAMARAEERAHAFESSVEPTSSKVAAILSPRPQAPDTCATVVKVGSLDSRRSDDFATSSPLISPRDAEGAGALSHDAACMPAQCEVFDWKTMEDGPLMRKLRVADSSEAVESGGCRIASMHGHDARTHRAEDAGGSTCRPHAGGHVNDREGEGGNASELFMSMPTPPGVAAVFVPEDLPASATGALDALAEAAGVGAVFQGTEGAQILASVGLVQQSQSLLQQPQDMQGDSGGVGGLGDAFETALSSPTALGGSPRALPGVGG